MTTPVKVVLLAGGQGDRLWPTSTPQRPKPFLHLAGDKSLLRTTFERALALVSSADIYVVTGAEYAQRTRKELPELPLDQLILEPSGRDTAPSLGLAALWISNVAADAVLVLLPADHHVVGLQKLTITLGAAVDAARRGAPVLLGVKPTWPATGFGYIEMGEQTGEERHLPVHRVQRFVEKPDAAAAQAMLATGRHLWNSGILVAPVARLQQEIARHLPVLADVLQDIATAGTTFPALQARTLERFAAAPRISVDYGILEHCADLLVLPAHFDWCDVGDWAALASLRPQDSHGNILHGDVVAQDCRGSIVEADSGRLVAILGLADTIVVDTPEALLVCSREHAQQVKQLAAVARPFATAAAQGHVPAGRIVTKPWGREIWWAVTERYAAKLLEVHAGESLSLQYHERKLETLYFQAGQAHVRLGETWQTVGPGTVCTIPPGTLHQVEALTDLRIVEVSTPDLDDVVRVSDRYGRQGAPEPAAQP